MPTSINNSVYSFRNPGHHFGKVRAAIAFVLLGTLFFSTTRIVHASSSVPAPEWIGGETMQATIEKASVQFAASEPVANVGKKQTFIISAYYSPLEGQQKYVTGSYAGDIRLNGSGVNGADGTPVYPGMIAAPKSYPFGTKMHIPGVGTVAVHDRGGAIVHSGERGNAYDRLDVWMGHGDAGLQRALQWGKRTVEVTVYGVDDSIQEHVELDGYSVSEKHTVTDSFNSLHVESDTASQEEEPSAVVQVQLFSRQLSLGDSGEDVGKLQNLLSQLGFYHGEVTSNFDNATYEAVAAFQLQESIIPHKTAFGVGYVGPKTMTRLASARVSEVTHARSETVVSSGVFDGDLKPGDSGEAVRQLQEELRKVNLLGIQPTGYYGDVTEHAVFKFQQSQKLAGDKNSQGAGIFGPVTRSRLNALIAARLESEKLKLARAGL